MLAARNNYLSKKKTFYTGFRLYSLCAYLQHYRYVFKFNYRLSEDWTKKSWHKRKIVWFFFSTDCSLISLSAGNKKMSRGPRFWKSMLLFANVRSHLTVDIITPQYVTVYHFIYYTLYRLPEYVRPPSLIKPLVSYVQRSMRL